MSLQVKCTDEIYMCQTSDFLFHKDKNTKSLSGTAASLLMLLQVGGCLKRLLTRPTLYFSF